MEHKIKLGVVLSLVLGGFYYFYAQGSGETSTFNTTSQETESLKTEVETKSDKPVQAATAQPEKIMVDVKGQVKNQGFINLVQMKG